jgi:hypothetical protein
VATSELLEWANRADLIRVRGVTHHYADLLETAGVDTVKELAARRPDNLHRKLVEVAAGSGHNVPDAQEVEDWVAAAKELPPAITH